MHKKIKGFSLIELAIVVMVIGILSVVATAYNYNKITLAAQADAFYNEAQIMSSNWRALCDAGNFGSEVKADNTTILGAKASGNIKRSAMDILVEGKSQMNPKYWDIYEKSGITPLKDQFIYEIAPNESNGGRYQYKGLGRIVTDARASGAFGKALNEGSLPGDCNHGLIVTVAYAPQHLQKYYYNNYGKRLMGAFTEKSGATDNYSNSSFMSYEDASANGGLAYINLFFN